MFIAWAFRTLECTAPSRIRVHDFTTLAEARQVIGKFIEQCNREWRLERHRQLTATPANVR